MRRIAIAFVGHCALMAVAGYSRCRRPASSGASSSSATGRCSLTPPPAYTPPPKGAPPAEDTPAQREALARWKAKAEQRLAADRKEYNAEVTPTYNFHYGKKNPFTPGNIQVQGDGFLQPGAFPSAEYCGTCHQEAYSQWRQALHSNAFRTPFYRTSVNLLIRDKTRGIAFARHCDSCHNPIGVLGGALTEDSKVDRAKFDSDGLTCTTCHSVVSLDSTNGNASVKMGVPAVIVDEKGERIPGEVPFDMILRHPERHSKAVMHDFLHTPEFCAACHKANLPDPLNDYKFIRAFTAYDEWQQSKFSQRNPLTFYTADFTTCQGCHMKRNAITLPDYGAKNGTFVSHRWLAGNTAVPFYYGFDEQLNKTIEFLRAGNYLNVDIFALKKAMAGDEADCAAGQGLLSPCAQAIRSTPMSSSRTRTSATRSFPKCAISMRPGLSSRSKMRAARRSITAASSSRTACLIRARTASPIARLPTKANLSTTTRSGPFTPSPTTIPFRPAARCWCATSSACRPTSVAPSPSPPK